MLLFWVLEFALVVFACETTADSNATSRNDCCRKDCDGTVYDIQEATCCENKLHPGASLSCCGNEPYSPETATCCKHSLAASVTQGLSEKVSNCCELKAYNPVNEICCQSTIIAKPGPMAKCCGKGAYDVEKELCCGPTNNKTILMRNSSHHQCCGHNQYDTKTQCCCSNKENILEIQPKDSDCCMKDFTGVLPCGNMTFDTHTQLCCQLNVVHKSPQKYKCCDKGAYDVEKELCCGPTNNKTILMRNSSHHQCCGHNQYDTKTQCCCSNKENILEIQPKDSDCCMKDFTAVLPCGNMTFDTHTQLCCQLNVVHKSPQKYKCCDKGAYDVEKELCCGPTNNKTILMRNSSHHQCCGHNQYDTKTQCCCSNKENILEIQPKDSDCCMKDFTAVLPCGSMTFDKHTQLCCQLNVVHKSPQKYKCCGKSAYDVEKELCCGPTNDKKILTRKSIDHVCCHHGQFNRKTECCCWENDGAEIQPKNSSCCVEEERAAFKGAQQQITELQPICTEPNTHLCGSLCYNPKEHRCCERNRKPHCPSGLRSWKSFNCKGICCSQFHGSPGQHCCGTEVYWPHAEICCNGHRHFKSNNLHCCGVKAYNIKDPQMKCCAGTLYNLTSLDEHGGDAQCCGSILQKPQDICCLSEDKEVLYSAKTGFGCCGHLYYNTTLWSCCAGRLRSIHESGQDQRKMKSESRLLSVNNLNKANFCKVYIGTVESVSMQSVVFRDVLKVHGEKAKVKALPLPYILQTSDLCSSPKLIPGKTYIFNKDSILTGFINNPSLQSFYFIISKCSP